jgi:hypothetical protein
MANPLVKTVVKNLELECKRFQMDELVVPATVPEMLSGYGLPMEELNVSKRQRETLLVRHNDKLARHGSSFCLERRGKKFFIIHMCRWGDICEVFEEEISESKRVWRPELLKHVVIVPKIN